MNQNNTDSSFLCVTCFKKELSITQSIELGPGDYSDERTLQTIQCGNCGFEGIAFYEESRQGNIDGDSHHHFGYKVSKEVYDAVNKAIKNNYKNIDVYTLFSGVEFFRMSK